jgi:ubiquinone/menaquinone biosynthesis C-methylase UbiE/RimJ/RimL family protein N-acetyltransferase
VTVRLEPIGPDNWYACSRLEVRDDQRDAVAGNLLSIAELQFHPTWGGFAVRDGEAADAAIVGFISYEHEPDTGEWWISSLMIDASHQGRGRGRAAVGELLDLLHRRGCREVHVGYAAGNDVAAAVYRAHGFEDQGLDEEGDHVAVKRWADSPPVAGPQLDLDSTDIGDFFDELPLWSAPFGRLLLDRVPLGPGLTYLDVGAGTGFLTMELAQRCGPGARVIAVDPWEAAMTRARAKVERLGLRNVELRVEDSATLDLPDGSVDVIVSNVGINNFEDPDAVLRNCHRMARPGAALLLTTNVIGHMREFYAALSETLQGDEPARGRLARHEAHRGTVDSVTARLASNGFRVTNVTEDAFRLRFATAEAMFGHFLIRIGFLHAWREVVEGCPGDLLAEAGARLERGAGEDGVVLTVPVCCVEAVRTDA